GAGTTTRNRLRGDAGPRTRLEDLIAQLESVQGPGDGVAGHVARPPLRPAQAVVDRVHGHLSRAITASRSGRTLRPAPRPPHGIPLPSWGGPGPGRGSPASPPRPATGAGTRGSAGCGPGWRAGTRDPRPGPG